MSLTNNPLKTARHLGLVVIDMQAGTRYLAEHVYKQPAPVDFTTLLANNQLLIDAFTAHHLPIFIVTMRPKAFPHLFDQTLSRSLFDNVQLQVHRLEKHLPSAFSQPALVDALRAAGVKHLVVTGIAAENGVCKTVRDATRLGFPTTVIVDAILAKSQHHYQDALRHFEQINDTKTMIESL